MARIVIADDASFMRGSLKFIVEKEGHEVVGVATNGRDAIEQCRKLKPDLLTLDVIMPEMDGISALEAIKKENPSVKVIMVTAIGQENKQEEARGLGASGYIRKPFKLEEITAEIKRVLAGKTPS